MYCVLVAIDRFLPLLVQSGYFLCEADALRMATGETVDLYQPVPSYHRSIASVALLITHSSNAW